MTNDEVGTIIGIGIDQGVCSCGYGIVALTERDEIEVLNYGTLQMKSGEPIGSRLETIVRTVREQVGVYKPTVMGMERLFFNPKQTNGRNKSASIMQTNMATGILYLVAHELNLVADSYVPGTVKKEVAGNGRAKKEDVEQAIAMLLDASPVAEVKRTEHSCDAVAIAITALKVYKQSLLMGDSKESIKSNKKKTNKKKTTKGDKKDEK